MGYRIASFNMYKFHENTSKEVALVAKAINDSQIDILVIQEIFSRGALDKLIGFLGPNEWEGRWDTPQSKSPSAAEGYAFAWRKSKIGLTKKSDGRVIEPTILNQYKLHKEEFRNLLEKYNKISEGEKLPNQEKLVRNPYYARFSPADLPGGTYFEFRIINSHIMWSMTREENENDYREEDSVSLSDVLMRKNEYNMLTYGVYPKVSNKDVDYLMEQNDVKYMPAYTILMGDYNLNLDSYPKIDEPERVLHGYGIRHYEYNPSGDMILKTFQDKRTTLKSKEKLQYDPEDKEQQINLMLKSDYAFYANNFDHFTYDTVAFSGLDVVELNRLDIVEKIFVSEDTEDPFKPYRLYREKISDHLPIVIEIEIKKR